jgi:hypothetical protein
MNTFSTPFLMINTKKPNSCFNLEIEAGGIQIKGRAIADSAFIVSDKFQLKIFKNMKVHNLYRSQ